MKFWIILASVFLVLGIVGVGFADTYDEESISASVSVSQHVSITIVDAGAQGINFGGGNPGDVNKPDIDQEESTPAIKVKNEDVSNVDITVNVKGEDFVGNPSGSFAVSQVTYDDDNTPDEGGSETGKEEKYMENSYPSTDYYTNVAPGSTADFWFFIDIPNGTDAATYTSQFTFRGEV